MTIVAGVDFGTASVRVSVFHDERGRLGSGAADYPVLRKPDDPDYAAQRHQDHLRALEHALGAALAAGRVDGREVEALAIATTGSTVVAVDEQLQPLSDYYLWCDHRASQEAAQITATARDVGLEALDWCGGTYSSEWGFAKVLHWLRRDPPQRAKFHTAMEHCDLIVATLCGIRDREALPRSICAMGHKWMWNPSLGGIPSDDFLTAVDPLLRGVNERLRGRYATSKEIAGHLSDEWAARLKLRSGIPIPTGALDAHWDAIGVGCRLGDVVNVIGTSTCIMALSAVPAPIPGVSGVVQGSIHPDLVGIEAGLSAVGDMFDAIARRANVAVGDLATQIANHRAGQTGLLRFAWDNGDRSVLVNPHLRGMTLGWRLHHTAADELFAAIEGTAFHTRIILERLQEYNVPVHRLVNAGGIPQRNETLNRVYAGALNMPILVPTSSPTSLGSALFAFLAAGAFESVESAQQALCPALRAIEPLARDVSVYEELYGRFKEIYFSRGGSLG